MTGRYKAYPEYKDSGVEWLGNVPLHWKLSRLGGMFDERSEKVSDKDFSALSVTKDGIVPQLDNAAKTDSGDNRKKVCVDDFVINSRSDRKGSSGTSKLNGSVSLISIVLSPTGIYPDFAHHLLRSYPFQNEFYRYGKGIHADLWSTNYSEMKNIILAMPDDREQQKIANFLDHETAKIDTLIAKQEKLIELLKEKRQAVISHAVTKGLNPNAPMRDSGVEWLGEVPKHWEIKKIKHCASLISSKQKIDGQQVIALENIEGLTGDFVATNSNYNGEDVAFLEGDILFGKLRPYLAKVFLCQKSGIAFGDLLTYRPNQKTESSFLFYTMISSWFIEMVDSSTYGAKMPRASSEFVNEMFICFPPLEEQKTIYKELDTILQHFKTLTDKANKAIELMKERKTALISAAVTGKIDVRDFVSEQGQPQGV